MFGKLGNSVQKGDRSELTEVSPALKSELSGDQGESGMSASRQIYLIGQPETPRVWIKVSINGKIVRGLLDTGAEKNVLHESLVYKLFGSNPPIANADRLVIKGVGENVGVNVVGELTGRIDLQGIRLEDMSFAIMPLSVSMSSPLILGMDFLRLNKFTINPGDRILSSQSSDGSGHYWVIDGDGNPIDMRFNRTKCRLTDSVEIEPHGSVSAIISIADPVLKDYSDRSAASQIFLIESHLGTTPNNFEIPDGVVSSGEMRIMMTNDSSSPRKISKGTVVAVATTILEVDNEGVLELWDMEQLEKEIKLEELTGEQKQSVLGMLSEVSMVFSKGEYDVDEAAVTAHKIQLTDSTPTFQRARRCPEPINQEIERQCMELEAADIIERSVSPWNAPVVPIRKGNGKIRLCIDYRRLNAQTKPDRSPIPCLADAVYGINQRKYFTSVDLVKGYYQLPLSPESREFTAFSTAYSHYQFKRLSFGLRNAPATFQREIQSVLSDFPKRNVIVYFDDILIMEDTFEAHLELVSKVLHTLAVHGMKINPSKCQWFGSQVDFLGHTISAAGLRKQDSYVRKVEEFPLPETVKQLQQFLGLVNFQRKFLKNASITQKPLSELTSLKKNVRIEWTKERRQAFAEIKAGMKEDVQLAFPSYEEDSEKIVLWVDASDSGAGACLMQRQHGEERVIAYNSMTFSDAQRRYSTVDRELAALRWAVKAFKSFLYGVEFVIRTDHQPLVYLHSMRVVDNRLARTLADLSEFNFSIEYVPGSTNTAADALSRLVIHPSGEEVLQYASELPKGLEYDGDVSAGGGDSVFLSIHRWLRNNCQSYKLESALKLREQLMDELSKNPNKYGIKSPSKQWRRDMTLRRLHGQLPPVEVLLVCSYMYKLKLDVYYWNGDPVSFVDWRIVPVDTVSLQCLAGIHYNLIRRVSGGSMVSKPVYYCSEPIERTAVQGSLDADSNISPVDLCDCRPSSHPLIQVEVGGSKFCAVLDTGAEISLIRRDVFDRISESIPLTLDKDQVVYIEGYSGLVASMAGGVDLQLLLTAGMQCKKHTFAVVDTQLISQCFLLGIDFLSANSLAIDAARDCIIQVKPRIVEQKFMPYRVMQSPYPVAHVSTTEDLPPPDVERESLPVEISPFLEEGSVKHDQKSDPSISSLGECVLSVPRKEWPTGLSGFCRTSYDYQFRDGVLFCKSGVNLTVVVSWNLLVRIVLALHLLLAHIGRDKMLHLLRQHIFHPNLYMAVRDVCQSCPDCQIMKISRQVYVPPTLKILTSSPFELVAADMVLFPRTSDGFIGCIIVVDHNSKWISAVAVKNKTSKSMVNAFKGQILPFLPRCPSKILTDNGSEFASREFNNMLEEFGIQHIYTTPYRPQSNGCIERVNRTIGGFLRSIDGSNSWTAKLTSAVMVYNNTLHQSIGMSPGSYLLGRSHLAADLPAISSDAKQFWDYGHSKFSPFVLGQSVIRKLPVKGHCTTSKFQAKYGGPYTIVRVNPNDLTYVIRRLQKDESIRVHHSQLALWIDPPSYLVPFLANSQSAIGNNLEQDPRDSGDSSSDSSGGCVLALSSDSDVESVDSGQSCGSSGTQLSSLCETSSPNRNRETPGNSDEPECIFYDVPCTKLPSVIQNKIIPAEIQRFSEVIGNVSSKDDEVIFQDLEPVIEEMNAVVPNSGNGSFLSDGSDPVSVCNLLDKSADNEIFCGFLDESRRQSRMSRDVLESVRLTGLCAANDNCDICDDPQLSTDVNTRRVRFNSSSLENDNPPVDEMINLDQVSSITDWDMSFEGWDDEPMPDITPSPPLVGVNAGNVRTALKEFCDSMNRLHDELLESENSGPSVSKMTPIINDRVLSRMCTRSRGPVEELPYIMKQPLEHKKQI